MDYPSIRGEEIPYYSKNSTWRLLNAYIYAQNQRLIDAFPGYGEQAISRLQSQCANMKISDQIRYNRLYQKVVHKGGNSEINYIEIFQNSTDLKISVGNRYSEYQFMQIFLDNL